MNSFLKKDFHEESSVNNIKMEEKKRFSLIKAFKQETYNLRSERNLPKYEKYISNLLILFQNAHGKHKKLNILKAYIRRLKYVKSIEINFLRLSNTRIGLFSQEIKKFKNIKIFTMLAKDQAIYLAQIKKVKEMIKNIPETQKITIDFQNALFQRGAQLSLLRNSFKVCKN